MSSYKFLSDSGWVVGGWACDAPPNSDAATKVAFFLQHTHTRNVVGAAAKGAGTCKAQAQHQLVQLRRGPSLQGCNQHTQLIQLIPSSVQVVHQYSAILSSTQQY